MKGQITRATIVLIGLAIVFAVLAVKAKLVFAGDGFSQGLLLVNAIIPITLYNMVNFLLRCG